ncbi:MAG: hypothetical protein ACQETP_12035, partial [Bacteroidota bacterium]
VSTKEESGWGLLRMRGAGGGLRSGGGAAGMVGPPERLTSAEPLKNRIGALYPAKIGKRGGFSILSVTYSAAHHFYGPALFCSFLGLLL